MRNVATRQPCKDSNARFTTLPLKPKADKRCGIEKSLILLISLFFFKSKKCGSHFYRENTNTDEKFK